MKNSRYKTILLLLLGLFTLPAMAGNVMLHLTGNYTLPARITKVQSVVRYCTKNKFCSRVCVANDLAPSGHVNQQVFVPDSFKFVQPGVVMVDNNNGMHFAYCSEQIPYSLHYTSLTVVFSNLTKGQTNTVQCKITTGGV